MEVKHKDHTISYRESSNDWFSAEIGIKPSLAAAKKAIDDLLRKGRRADIKALWLKEAYWGGNKPVDIIEVTIGAMSEPYQGREISQAWITYKSDRRNEREKVSLGQLYALADRPKLDEYMRLVEATKKAEAEAEKFKEGMQSLTAETIHQLKGGEPK